jgi:hypothetical protein
MICVTHVSSGADFVPTQRAIKASRRPNHQAPADHEFAVSNAAGDIVEDRAQAAAEQTPCGNADHRDKSRD